MLKIVLFTIVMALAPSVRAQQFVTGFEDLPLMDGFTEIEGGDLAFDTPSGRIVEAHAISKTVKDPKEVTAFYKKALKGLGWKVYPARFTRDGEVLTITAVYKKPDLIIKFELKGEETK